MNIQVGDDITTGGTVREVRDNIILVELPTTAVWIKTEDVKSWRPNKKESEE